MQISKDDGDRDESDIGGVAVEMREQLDCFRENKP